jgi:SH3 domain-containing YSC84-like protein 1
VRLVADASVAAGPKGRTASADTDAYLRAQLLIIGLAWSGCGPVAGGIDVSSPQAAHHRVYGSDVSATKIVTESKIETPPR